MRKYGAFEVEQTSYNKHTKLLPEKDMQGAKVDASAGDITKDGKTIGVMIDGQPYAGFPTPSRKQEFYSQTMVDWGWPEYKIPVYVKSHIHQDNIDSEKGGVPAGTYLPPPYPDPFPFPQCQMAHGNLKPQSYLDAHLGRGAIRYPNRRSSESKYRHWLFRR